MPREMKTFFSAFLLFSLLFTSESSSFDSPKRLTKSLPPSLLPKPGAKPQEFFEITLPLPFDRLAPTCTYPILRRSFGNTIGGPPFTTRYRPPAGCPSPPWSIVAVELRARCRGKQFDRIAAVWLGGVELLRTSTAEPTVPGIFWRVRKDITRYSSVLARSDLNLTVMLENAVDGELTGVYHVEADLLFYNRTADRDAAEKPADMILPISDSGERGFWFRSENSDPTTKMVKFPRNTRRAVLELCASSHGNDEFWYSNPPNAYVEINNLETGRANGAYRELFVTIDGELAGAELPFPVIFTGGINPLSWEPIVAIGAFNLPTYDFELTPFLGKLLDRKPHKIGIGVTDGIAYWLVNANLHLWVDAKSGSVQATSPPNPSPALTVKRSSSFQGLDGSFKIGAGRTVGSTGSVSWSGGNHTTSFTQQYKMTCSVKYLNDGAHKTLLQRVTVSRDLSVVDETKRVVWQESHRRSVPLMVVTARLDGKKDGEFLAVTNVSHAVKGRVSLVVGDLVGSRKYSNAQDSGGWLEVKNHTVVVAGGAETRQTLNFRDLTGGFLQMVVARNGKIVANDTWVQSLPPITPR